MKNIIVKAVLVISIILLSSCSQTMQVLDGATHACGVLHVEGYFTDTQGEVRIMKLPGEWNVEQALQFCP